MYLHDHQSSTEKTDLRPRRRRRDDEEVSYFYFKYMKNMRQGQFAYDNSKFCCRGRTALQLAQKSSLQ